MRNKRINTSLNKRRNYSQFNQDGVTSNGYAKPIKRSTRRDKLNTLSIEVSKAISQALMLKLSKYKKERTALRNSLADIRDCSVNKQYKNDVRYKFKVKKLEIIKYKLEALNSLKKELS